MCSKNFNRPKIIGRLLDIFKVKIQWNPQKLNWAFRLYNDTHRYSDGTRFLFSFSFYKICIIKEDKLNTYNFIAIMQITKYTFILGFQTKSQTRICNITRLVDSWNGVTIRRVVRDQIQKLSINIKTFIWCLYLFSTDNLY